MLELFHNEIFCVLDIKNFILKRVNLVHGGLLQLRKIMHFEFFIQSALIVLPSQRTWKQIC